jgi:hypothetical protein
MDIIYELPLFSKLHDEELLFIELFRGDPLLMTKGEFLQSDEWKDYPYNISGIHIAVSETISFDLKDYIDTIGEEAYEDWNEQVWDSIKDTPETKAFLELINRTIDNHPVYYAGRAISMDVFPNKSEE